jgi:hypothetical protein
MSMPAPPGSWTASPSPAPKKPKRWPWILGMVATLFIGIGIGAAGAPPEEETTAASPVAESPTTEAPASPSPSPTPTPEPVPPKPSGKYGLASCDEQSTGGGYQLAGSTEVTNDGEVEATYEITFAWLLGDGTKVEAKPKTITLAPDRSRLVFFRRPSSIDQVLNFQDHPDYFDSKNCRTRVTIR